MEIINLDMTPSTVTPNAHAGQYDSSRTVRFMLKNGGVPFTLAGTETITAEITRSDNTEVTVNVANTSSNYVDVVFDDTVCTVKGLYACELRIVNGGVNIGSKNFALLVQRDPYDGKNVRIVTVGPADICTFETTLPEPLISVKSAIVATGGNGTPDNPNPIVGYSSANITRCGVNLFDNEFPDLDNTVRYKHIKTGNGTFTLSSDCPLSEGAACLFFLAGNVSSGASTAVNGVSNGISRTVTTSDGYVTIAYRYYGGSPTIYPNDYHTQLEKGSTPSAYTPYNGQTYTIAFGQTCYGGQLDVTRGKLHVTHFIKDSFVYGETALIAINQYNIANFGIVVSTPFKFSEGAISSCLERQYTSGADTQTPGFFINNSNELYVRLESTTASNVSDFVTWANANLQILFTLATPFDIDLTPEVISAIVGTNNVFADCGETTVKYLKAGA